MQHIDIHQFLGQKRYMVLPWERIIVSVTIDEASRTWYVPGNREISSVWEYVYLDPQLTSENSQAYEMLEKWKMENPTAIPSEIIFVDIDEPVGHSEYESDYPKTLDEACKLLSESIETFVGKKVRHRQSKKHTQRLLRNWRNQQKRCIASTWRTYGNHPGFPEYAKKKVYV